MPPITDRVHLRVLGTLAVLDAEGADTGLTGLPALLFAYLVDRGVSVPRSELAVLFWPDAEAARARHGLRQALSRIRRCVGAERVVGTDPVGIEPAGVESDADLLEAALAADDVDRALDLWRGPFLNGEGDGLAWELAEWVELRRRELEAALLDTGRGVVRARMGREDFEGALALVGRLEACVPGDPGLAMDGAELLLELGRPHEAEVRLAAAGLDAESGPRAAGILRRAARTAPEPVAAADAPGTASVDERPPPRGRLGDAPTHPAGLGDAPGRPAPRPPSRRWAALVGGAAAVLAVAGWMVRPLPLPDATITFCAHRETRYGFELDVPSGAKNGVLTEPGCPIFPLGGDSLLVFQSDSTWATVELRTPDGRRVVFRNATGGRVHFSSGPLRTAGRQDGVVSPDGRRVLLLVERADRPRPQRPELMRWADEGPVPGVPELRRDPPFDWDLVVLDVVTGDTLSVGPPGDNVRDGRFTPDGDAVVYVNDATGNGDLHRTDLATGETTRLSDHPRMERSPVVGRNWTVFWLGSGTDEDPEDIGVLNHATGEITVLHPAPWNQAGPDLSPDERHVCWSSRRLGHWEGDIVVARVDGRGEPRILRAPGRDDNCQWLGEDHVLFRSWRTGPGELFVQSLRPWGEAENLTLWNDEIYAPFVETGR